MRVWAYLLRFFMGRIAVFLTAVLLLACVGDDVDRGNQALTIGDYPRAIANFSKALDQEPANRDARYGLALAYYAVAEQQEHLRVPTFELWQKASQEFEILSRVDESGKINANYSTCLFYLARATVAHNSRANVLPMLDQSIQLDSLNYFSLNLKALILGEKGRVEEAKKIFVHIVTREPKFASAYVNLGNLYWDEGDVESAWDIWSMGLDAVPNDKALAHWTQVAEDSLRTLVQSGRL